MGQSDDVKPLAYADIPQPLPVSREKPGHNLLKGLGPACRRTDNKEPYRGATGKCLSSLCPFFVTAHGLLNTKRGFGSVNHLLITVSEPTPVTKSLKQAWAQNPLHPLRELRVTRESRWVSTRTLLQATAFAHTCLSKRQNYPFLGISTSSTSTSGLRKIHLATASTPSFGFVNCSLHPGSF